MPVTTIPGAYWVDRGRLLAGPYPAGGDEQHTKRRLTALRMAGVGLVVDLTEEGELAPYAALLGEGVRHARRAIPDFGTVGRDEYAGTLDVIDDALRAGTGVYVHCFGGLGRTGTVVGCWLVRHGLHDGDAVRRIAELRRDLPDARLPSPQTPEQCDVIARWRAGA